jgi:hypothetical protein
MIELLDTISQYAIPLFTLSGIFLIARKVKWGFLLALIAQPFWLFTSYIHDQWGVFFNTVVYTGIVLYGVYNWFFDSVREVSSAIDKAEKTE